MTFKEKMGLKIETLKTFKGSVSLELSHKLSLEHSLECSLEFSLELSLKIFLKLSFKRLLEPYPLGACIYFK